MWRIFLGMAIQAFIVSGLLQSETEIISVRQQFTAGVMFILLSTAFGFIEVKAKKGGVM